MTHHTKDKGDIGVGAVISDLLKKGVKPFIPISEHMPYDLIGVMLDGSMKRISVKYRESKNNTITVMFKSSYSDSSGVHTNTLDKDKVDIIAIYCPDTEKVYYVNPKNFNKQVVLRLNKPKNNQKFKVNMADNFLAL